MDAFRANPNAKPTDPEAMADFVRLRDTYRLYGGAPDPIVRVGGPGPGAEGNIDLVHIIRRNAWTPKDSANLVNQRYHQNKPQLYQAPPANSMHSDYPLSSGSGIKSAYIPYQRPYNVTDTYHSAEEPASYPSPPQTTPSRSPIIPTQTTNSTRAPPNTSIHHSYQGDSPPVSPKSSTKQVVTLANEPLNGIQQSRDLPYLTRTAPPQPISSQPASSQETRDNLLNHTGITSGVISTESKGIVGGRRSPQGINNTPNTEGNVERIDIPHKELDDTHHGLDHPIPPPEGINISVSEGSPKRADTPCKELNDRHSPRKIFDDYKLETEFRRDGHVVQRTYEWKNGSSTRIWKRCEWKRFRVIGVGASGDIWLEEEVASGSLRAVKQLRRRLKLDFTRELMALVKLRKYAHLFLRFLGWYENREYVYFAMEYIKHGNLKEYIKSGMKPIEFEIKEITSQILEGLEVLHKKGICHRDLKPENILMVSIHPIWVKIADFGISKRTKDTILRTRCGTDGYLAPEILGIIPGKNYTHALDIWSLGCVVYEMCTLLKPFYLPVDDDETDTYEYSGIDESVEESIIDMTSLIKYCNGKIDFPSQALDDSGLSEEGIAFIKDLFIVPPDNRKTAAGALTSPWLKGYTDYWLQNLETELSSIGANLDSERKRDLLLREVDKVDMIQYLSNPSEMVFETLLLKAVKKGYTLATAMLLQARTINPSTRGTIFRAAAEQKDLDMITILVHYEVHTGARIEDITVLEWLFNSGRLEIVQVVLQGQHGSSRTVLQAAAEVGNISTVRHLIQKGLGVNTPAAENGGRTALQAASGAGHKDTVVLLLDSGADVNADPAAESGRTALQAASEAGHTDIVKLLLEHEADVEAEAGAYKGLTALEAAKFSKNAEIIRLIEESLRYASSRF